MKFTFINQLTGNLVTQPPPCQACSGVCCSTAAGWKFIELSYQEQSLPLFAKRVRTHKPTGKRGFWFTPKGHGRKGGFCPYFDLKKKHCSIYERRPLTCRRFDCRACPAASEIFERNPKLVKLIRDQSSETEQPPCKNL